MNSISLEGKSRSKVKVMVNVNTPVFPSFSGFLIETRVATKICYKLVKVHLKRVAQLCKIWQVKFNVFNLCEIVYRCMGLS